MARKSDHLTAQATEGFNATDNADCPYLATSPSWFAWKVGAWLKRTGRSAPRNVSMGRGYHVNVNDMIVVCDNHNAFQRIR